MRRENLRSHGVGAHGRKPGCRNRTGCRGKEGVLHHAARSNHHHGEDRLCTGCPGRSFLKPLEEGEADSHRSRPAEKRAAVEGVLPSRELGLPEAVEPPRFLLDDGPDQIVRVAHYWGPPCVRNASLLTRLTISCLTDPPCAMLSEASDLSSVRSLWAMSRCR